MTLNIEVHLLPKELQTPRDLTYIFCFRLAITGISFLSVNRWPRLQRFYQPNENWDWLREYRTRHKVGTQIRRTVESISKRFFTEVVSDLLEKKDFLLLVEYFSPYVHHFMHLLYATCLQLVFLYCKLSQKCVTQPCVGQVLGDSFAEIESLGMPEHFCEDELLFILNSDKR